jgi:hypothetical protein
VISTPQAFERPLANGAANFAIMRLRRAQALCHITRNQPKLQWSIDVRCTVSRKHDDCSRSTDFAQKRHDPENWE